MGPRSRAAAAGRQDRDRERCGVERPTKRIFGGPSIRRTGAYSRSVTGIGTERQTGMKRSAVGTMSGSNDMIRSKFAGSSSEVAESSGLVAAYLGEAELLGGSSDLTKQFEVDTHERSNA